MRDLGKRVLALALALGVVATFYALVVRPWLLSWGSTAGERERALVGDDIAPGAVSTTRALSIDAPVAAVWPWLAQLGQDRAGFYSYEILEDLAGCQMPRAEGILPGAQEWKTGDSLWMYPPEKLDGVGSAPLRAVVPGRALAFATWRAGTAHLRTPDGSWAFVLEPSESGDTRLVVRSRGIAPRSLGALLFDRAVFEPMHFAMERRMMEGIRGFAEGRTPRTRVGDAAEVLTWTGVFAVFVWSVVAVLRRPHWRLPAVVAALAASGFLFLTLLQPMPLVGAIVLADLVAMLRIGDGGREPRALPLAPVPGMS
jgi:hypothetical protein